MNQKGKWRNFLLVFVFSGLDLLSGPWLLLQLKTRGYRIIPPAHASEDPGLFLLQTILLSAYSVFLVLGCRAVLKERFGKAMGLSLKGSRLLVGGLVLFLAGVLGIGIRRTGDGLTMVLGFIYFVFAVGFTEEFLYRGLCVWLLKDFPWQVRYLLPNFIFAMLHIFAYNQFMPLNSGDVIRFMTSEMPVLMASGCCLQILKDRTGTLWVPILLHGALDFMSLFP